MRYGRLLGALALAVGALTLAGCGPGAAPSRAPSQAARPADGAPTQAPSASSSELTVAPAPPRARLKMTYPSSSVNSLPVFVARDNGFFDRNGLEVETLLLTSDRAMAAVASGEIQYVGGVGPASVAATALGLPLRAVWVTATSPAYTIFTRPEIRTPDQLRGKRMGVPALGGTAAVVAGMALKHYGLESGRNVALAQLEGDALITESLRSGVIDAAPRARGPLRGRGRRPSGRRGGPRARADPVIARSLTRQHRDPSLPLSGRCDRAVDSLGPRPMISARPQALTARLPATGLERLVGLPGEGIVV